MCWPYYYYLYQVSRKWGRLPEDKNRSVWRGNSWDIHIFKTKNVFPVFILTVISICFFFFFLFFYSCKHFSPLLRGMKYFSSYFTNFVIFLSFLPAHFLKKKKKKKSLWLVLYYLWPCELSQIRNKLEKFLNSFLRKQIQVYLWLVAGEREKRYNFRNLFLFFLSKGFFLLFNSHLFHFFMQNSTWYLKLVLFF